MSLQEEHDLALTVAPVGAEALEAGLAADVTGAIEARSYWQNVWRTFKRDKVAIGGGVTIILLILLCYAGGPIFSRILGHGPNQLYDSAVTAGGNPVGPWSHFLAVPFTPSAGTVFFPLGSDGAQGRDEFLRLLYGGQVSLEIAVFATLVSLFLGVALGAAAGYFGGVIDMVISRITELVMAFPIILFVIALSAVAGPQLNGITFGFLQQGVFTITVVLAIFGWFYPARIARAQVLSLREKEFIEAARMVGSSDLRILKSHLLPHLVAPMIVLGTINVGQNVLAEAGLSFLGVGIQDPTASWGSLLEEAPQYYLQVPWLMLWPVLAILITTLAFNLLGDGLRDAFDPRTAR